MNLDSVKDPIYLGIMSGKSEKSNWKRLVTYVKSPRNAVPIKFVQFIFGAGAASIYPFLTLQMKLIGLSITEIGFIFLAVPVGSFLGPIISGLMADKFGKYNLVLAFNFFLTMISINLFLLIPHIVPPSTVLSCSEGLDCSLNIQNCGTCLQATTNPVSFILKNCQARNENTTSLSHETFTEIIYVERFNISAHVKDGCQFKMTDGHIIGSNLSLSLPEMLTCQIESSSDCFEELQPLYSTTFILFLFVDFLVNFFMSASFTMSDASLIALAKKYNLQLGRQKAMLTFGFALAPLLSGVLIDYHSSTTGKTTYFATFMLASALLLVAGIVMIFLKIEVPTDKDNMWKNSKKLLQRLDVVLFFIILLTFGVNFGFIESYLFIYLKSIGASASLLGLTLAAGNLASIPLLLIDDKVERIFGRQTIFLVCFACYAVRLAGYSYIRNPYMGLIFETLEAFTYQLFWITCLKLFPVFAPKGLLATMTGLSGSIHWCLGKSIGGFLGGQLIGMTGMRTAFRIMSFVSIGGGVFYLIANRLVLAKSILRKEKQMKEDEIIESKLKVRETLLGNDEEEHLPKVTIIKRGVEQSLLGRSSGRTTREVLTKTQTKDIQISEDGRESLN